MLKLLLLLAAVAALAVAVPSAAADFNDLDLDLDDSDLDDSELDASELDASGLDEIDTGDLDPLTTHCKKVDDCANSKLQCNIDQYISTSDDSLHKCTECPPNNVAAYDESVACGSGSCFLCPLIVDPRTKLCVTSYQKQFLRREIGNQKNFLRSAIQESQSAESVGIDMSELKLAELSKLEQVNYKYDSEQLCNSGNNGNGSKTNNIEESVQTTSCAIGTTCCLPGYYGENSASCTLCPSDKPSSPFSAPNSQCACPNSAANKCFACTNKCRPYDSVSRMCLPYQCPSGQTCKVQSGAATCV